MVQMVVPEVEPVKLERTAVMVVNEDTVKIGLSVAKFGVYSLQEKSKITKLMILWSKLAFQKVQHKAPE
ncbi:unnamed protein product [Allacma fusca]|uniref:Uncharacterized protein n=1 Tax=Allacma fusca TaxID=39272 RepID=A0A8J2J9W2_9HEXA|nr:unnamed protein product [Allacma fusca]